MGPVNQSNKANSRLKEDSGKIVKSLGGLSSTSKISQGFPKNSTSNDCAVKGRRTKTSQSPTSIEAIDGGNDIDQPPNSNSFGPLRRGSGSTSQSLPLKNITKYTNQGCVAFQSQQYNLAMRLFQDAHNLLHDYKHKCVGIAVHKKINKNESSRIRPRLVNARISESTGVDYIPTNSYIYQRLDFDEGMCTYSEPLKLKLDCDEMMIESILLYNKGQMYARSNTWDMAIICFQSATDASRRKIEDCEDESARSRLKIQYDRVHIAALQSTAQIQYRVGKYEEAIHSYKKAIRHAEKVYGEIHSSIGAAYNSLSVLYYHLMAVTPVSAGRETEKIVSKSEEYLKYAKDFSERSLVIRIETLGPNHKDVATTYNNIGRLHVMRGKFKDALTCYEEALRIRADTLSKKSLDYAATAFNAGQSYHHIQEYSKALKYYKEFLTVAVKHFTKNHRDVAVVLSGIAEIHQERGDMQKALGLYEESLEAGRNALGDDHPEVAMILNRLGNFHFVMENYDAAYKAYEKGFQIEKGNHDDANGIVSLCNLGEIHRQRKEWGAAVKVFKEVLKIQKKKFGREAQNAEIATTLNVIGLTYDKKGEANAALKYLQEALIMRRANLGDKHIEVAPTLTTIGIIFSRINRLGIALDLLKEALNIRITNLGKDHRDVAFTLYNIALIHQKQGTLTDAISCLVEVLRIERKVFGDNHKDVAITLFKLGETFKRQNDLDKALHYYECALEVERTVMQENDPLTLARTLTEIGNIHLMRGETLEMMRAFNEAARIYQSSSMSPQDVAVSTNLYAIDLVCPLGAPAA